MSDSDDAARQKWLKAEAEIKKIRKQIAAATDEAEDYGDQITKILTTKKAEYLKARESNPKDPLVLKVNKLVKSKAVAEKEIDDLIKQMERQEKIRQDASDDIFGDF